MGKTENFKKSGLISALLIISIAGCWTFPVSAAEKKIRAAEKEQAEQQQVKELFTPCHPPTADSSVDGTLFINALQDSPFLSLSYNGTEQKYKQIKLPKQAYDVVIINNNQAVVSYGPWGELAVIDLKQELIGKPFQVGESADGICKTSDGKVLVLDSETNNVYYVYPISQSKIKTFPLQSKPAQMRWLVPDLKIEAADAEGKVIASFKLPRQGSLQKQDETKK